MEPLNVLMIGTGEYTTGFVGGGASGSDKKVGVVGLSLFDLRRREKVNKLGMVGVNGKKFPAIREHLNKNIQQVYNNLDTSFDSFPENGKVDPDAYKTAIDALKPGDAITIFTPDPTHFPIAKYAIERGIHVMITKPAVKVLEEHQELVDLAQKKGVYVYVEHHKRYDPAYADARAKAQKLGDFNYFYSYMSQPKSQLETFKAWAGKESDISYYLNSHHIDICDSMVQERGYVPVSVNASSSKGVAVDLGCDPITEDTISLLVTWNKNGEPSKRAVGVYTASWTAPQKAGVHSNQYFHYLAANGEIRVDQAKRGYDVADDSIGQLMWYNPFYMKYAPDEDGNFAGQTGYGYISIEKFVDGCRAVNSGKLKPEDLDAKPLPTLKNTIATTAILEAGRRSIDENREVKIVVENGKWRLDIIIVDSTRRGKRMPDALSSTIPIWCTVLNLTLLPSNPSSANLYLPAHLPATTHSQICALIPGFVASFKALNLNLPTCLTKPLRPFWVTPDSSLPSVEDTSSIFDDFRPVICCTASRRVIGSEMDEGGYIQGAADDTEMWAHDLTAPLFWENIDELLKTPEAELPDLISRLVSDHAASKKDEGTQIKLTPHLSVCPLPLPANPSECRIVVTQDTTPKDNWIKSKTYMQAGLGKNKLASRNLRTSLPEICDFAAKYLASATEPNQQQIIVACESGRDLSVGVALAISCYLFDDGGNIRKSTEDVSFTKTFIKSRLGVIMTANPGANPSRATLQSVNSFLMDWRK
ncbi:hypothetical protein FOFC_10179 [Fusarium oxysporum]|nr:hypothetical protein FOFC_10179 [Fusarium oxysporum]